LLFCKLLHQRGDFFCVTWRPVRLRQHVIDNLKSTRFHDCECQIQAFILAW
jgi:hypothetical protein